MDYPPPVSQLLTRGAPDPGRWPDYLKLGFKAEHVPDLIRMATDWDLHHGDPESPAVYAPVHAWRALGQLRTAEAVGPLLELLDEGEEEDDDYILGEVPIVLGMIGPPAVPALAAFLSDPARGPWARNGVANAFGELVREHPEARAECAAVLARQLEQPEKNPPDLNGWIIAELVTMKAVEAAPLMERAYTAGLVDEDVNGSWDHVAYDLGLTDTPPAEPRHDFGLPPNLILPPPSPGQKKAKAKAKARRKQAKQSRKRNRKRKK